MYKLIVPREITHNITIETDGFKDSYFSNVLKSAWTGVHGIIKNQKDNNNSKFTEYCNNIILFDGERGTGKSSALATFINALDKSGEDDFVNEFSLSDEIIKELRKTKFKILDVIDPSHFAPEKNILYIFISYLFRSFDKKIRDKCHDPIDSDVKAILERFKKVFSAIQNLNLRADSSNYIEDLEKLSDLSGSLNLKDQIGALISKYLEIFECSNYLVVPIDDLDMNVDHAFQMLEQIRKFLIQDKIIIVMASNLNQLHLEIEEYYYQYFEKGRKEVSEKSRSSIDFKKMASMYLNKIIPPSRRLKVSHLEIDFQNTYLFTEEENKRLDVLKKSPKSDDIDAQIAKLENADNLIQRRILRMIWEKTGLIFIPEQDQLHPIIPHNMRSLLQIVHLLLSMKSTKLEKTQNTDNKKSVVDPTGAALKENFYKFKNFFMEHWLPFNLSSSEHEIFKFMPLNVARINKHLVQGINYIGNEKKQKIIMKSVDLDKIISPQNYQLDMWFSLIQYIDSIIKNNKPDKGIINNTIKMMIKELNQRIYKIKIIYNTDTRVTDLSNIPIGSKVKVNTNLTEMKNQINKIILDLQMRFKITSDIYTLVSINDPKFDEANKISDPYNYPSNNSMGDILLLIDKYEVYFESKEAVSFISAVKIFYSMLLFETLFLKSYIKFPTETNDAPETNVSKNPSNNLSFDLPPIQVLIGGTTYYPHYFDLIKDGKFVEVPRTRPHYFNFDYCGDIALDSSVDFLSYFILYYGSSRPLRPERNHIYDTDKDTKGSVAKFDILSFLVNTLNIDHTYKRRDVAFNGKAIDIWFTELIKNWIVDNQLITSESFIHPITYYPIYSVDVMLLLLRSTFKIDWNDKKEIRNKTENDLPKKGFCNHFREYFRKLNKLLINSIECNIGSNAVKYFNDLMSDNPFHKYFMNEAKFIEEFEKENKEIDAALNSIYKTK